MPLDADDDASFIDRLERMPRQELRKLVSRPMDEGHRLHEAFLLCRDIGRHLKTRRRDFARRPAHQRYVYVVRSEDLVKIGIATNPQSRLATLRTQACRELDQVFVVAAADALAVERAAHKRFARSRRLGEWFAVPFAEAVDFVSATIEMSGTALRPSSPPREVRFTAYSLQGDLFLPR